MNVRGAQHHRAVGHPRAAEESEMEVELDQGMQALIIGLMAMLDGA